MRILGKMKQHRGFTMIEVVIVMAIVAILAAIAYPSYSDYVVRTKRAEGKALLTRVAAEQERFFTARGQYTNQLAVAKPNGLGFVNNQSERDCYRVNIALAGDGMSYTMTAVPQNNLTCGEQAARDSDCTSFSLTSNGVRSATGANPAECW